MIIISRREIITLFVVKNKVKGSFFFFLIIIFFSTNQLGYAVRGAQGR